MVIGVIQCCSNNKPSTHHGKEHLWPEHPTVADLNPLVKAGVESKDLHTEGAQVNRVLSNF